MSTNGEHLLQEYQQNGFVVVRQFLAGSALEELKDELDRFIRDVVPGLPASNAFYHDRDRPETLKQLSEMQD
ncbi:MAG: phytanoyl-CoA dioxygenase family protein, partial [Planctomycetaceae bacterium]|nr:phytanoyl-CoA dioxygenase family protein [Planctomycetaceae bacterium]